MSWQKSLFSVLINCHILLTKGLFTSYVSQKWGIKIPLPPLSAKNQKLAYAPLAYPTQTLDIAHYRLNLPRVKIRSLAQTA